MQDDWTRTLILILCIVGMSRLKRALFFWTLALLFLITAPVIVMRAKGYRFDFNRGVFVHSGTVALKINPSNADIYIDGKLQKSASIDRINSSINLTGLIPGEYTLTIKNPDFQTWSKKIEVHSGIATEFWNILLMRKDYPRTQYETSSIDKFFISPKDELLLYTQKTETGISVNVLNIKSNEIENTFSFPEWTFIEESRKENIEWSPEEDYASIPLKKISLPKNDSEPEYAYFIIKPQTGEALNLNQFLEKKIIKNVRWDPEEKNYLFFMEGNSVYRSNIERKDDLRLIAENVSSFELSESYVYYSELPNELIYKTSLDGQSEKTQVTYTVPDSMVSKNEKLIVYDELRIAFINEDKDLFIYNRGSYDTYFRKLGKNIEGIQFSDDGKKLLYWDSHELFVYFLRDWTTQPLRSENDMISITRYSENLKNIQWFKDYEHILFSIGTQIKIVGLDFRDKRSYMDVLKTSTSNPFFIYNSSLEKLFFIDEKDNQSNLYSANMPEKSGILGLQL